MLKKNIATFILVFSLQSLVCCLVFAEQAVVKRVIDGDTVVLADETRVRLIGIDAPEIENRDYARRGEPYGEKSKQLLKKWVEGESVDLRDGPEKEDRYHRRLAYLYLENDFFVNLELVEVGAAEAYRKFPHPFQRDFFAAEKRARDQKLGIWGVEKKVRNWWERLWGIQPQ
ncbi:MAG TPA: thermonuclease family protein [Candidatus Omnitrophota bacterium]|nr:thermonuclease family protein [Candidatus Omnitrophota bacterium]